MPYIFFMAFFFMAFMAVSTDSIKIGGAIGNVNVNAPFVVMQILSVMSVIGIFVVVPLMSTVIIRDYEFKTYPTLFTTRLSRFDYLVGRLTGGFLVTMFSFTGLVAGVILGGLMPWIDPARVGPFMPSAYPYTFLIFVVPNILISGALFFSLATATRSLMWTYVGVVASFVLWMTANTFLGDLDNRAASAFLDPFGVNAFSLGTQYWTVIEKNTRLLPLDSMLLYNRLFWIGLSCISVAITVGRFEFAEPAKNSKRKAGEPSKLDQSLPLADFGDAMPVVNPNFSTTAYLKQFVAATCQELSGIVKAPAFIIIAMLGLFNLWANIVMAERIFGTEVHLVTRVIVEAVDGGFTLFLYIVLTIYGGEMIWRTRQMGAHNYLDALPVPEWVTFGSKLLALVLVVFVMQSLAVVMGITMQLLSGYYNIEPVLYIKALFINQALNISLVAFMVMFVHVVVNNKYLAHGVVAAYYLLVVVVGGALGLENNLYLFSATPDTPYSDMNGFGHYVTPAFWYNAYWYLFAVIIAGVGILFWVRGTDSGFKSRLKTASARRSLSWQAVIVVCSLGFLATGGFIFYNTNVLNKYRTSEDDILDQVNYERSYKKYEHLPQPRIVDVYTEVDFYPEKRDVDIRGRYKLVNKNNHPLDSVHVRKTYPQNLKQTVNKFLIAGAEPVFSDTLFDYYIYRLDEPLLPGDSLLLSFDISYTSPGFLNDGSNQELVSNGSFINNRLYFPHIGYSADLELSSPNDRRENDLPPRKQMPSISDSLEMGHSYLGNDADLVKFETIVSTTPEQIAISPGYLQREWVANNRRYFHYKMDQPILNFYSYLSANYKVRRDKWKGIDIEIYYHTPHRYNLDKMIRSVKNSIAYFSENFSPYQHNQLRIIEFPGYSSFAQSFPNTIPYSESIGFIANLKDESAIDYVFYVTAHEVAHQWWAHQVISANMQGATVMSETMAQYSALMVMEKEYGRSKMKRFLKYELDRYLKGRSSEQVREWPLIYNVNQPYIHYRKGSLVMYALRDYIGEAELNGALRDYIKDTAYRTAPYSTSLEFLEYIRKAVPDSLEYVIEDWFETITLYDNRVTNAVYRTNADGKYTVTLELFSRKVRADSLGRETEADQSDWIEIGILGDDEKELYLAKHKFAAGSDLLNIVVAEKPVQAGIDPQNLLIDRNPDDNMKRVVKE